MFQKSKVMVLLLILALLLILLACDLIPDKVDVGVKVTANAKLELEQQTRGVLEDAIKEIGRQPDRWEETLQNTIDKLGDVGGDTAERVLREVQSVYTRSLGQTENATFCGADFVGSRVRTRLQQVLHDFGWGDKPMVVPVVCLVEPEHVGAGTTQLVKFYGFDFLEFERKEKFSVDLEYASGEIVKQNFGHDATATNYFLQVDIQGADFSGLDATKGPRIVLKWEGQEVEVEGEGGRRSEIPVLLATPTKEPPPTSTPTPTKELPLPSCVDTGPVSDKTDPFLCRSGYALKGIECEDDQCGKKTMKCCPYMHGQDTYTHDTWTKWISGFKYPTDYQSDWGFVVGLECFQDFGENIRMQIAYSADLVNDGHCYFEKAISGKGSAECEYGFVAGMKCTGRYCENLALYCCESK
jgi:hypothetical protein